MVEFEHIEIGYKTPLLRVDQLKLEEGSLYSLIGKNGVGKSTFLQSILNLTAPLSGKIRINGVNTQSCSPKALAGLVAFVPSKFDGVQHLSAEDYVLMGRAPYTSFTGRYSDQDKRVVDEVFRQMNIGHLRHKETLKMSDGERQIASIAKALVQQTPLILLDEPTAFLDYSNRMSILSLLKEIAVTNKKCILQSSHDLDLCIDYSDTLLVVSDEVIYRHDRDSFDKEALIRQAYSR